MGTTRRDAGKLILSAPLLLAGTKPSWAAPNYTYDALGRVVQVVYPNGIVVKYTYDAAGNRTQVNSFNPGPFTASINVTGTGPVNLRTLADNAGYYGEQDATVTYTVASATTILGPAGGTAANPFSGGIAIDTGDWPTTRHAISLQLVIAGKVYGGGGPGGIAGQHGGDGGDALYCRVPIGVNVQAGGALYGGGGGGGGGGEVTVFSAGGGGGGFPNGLGGAGIPSGNGSPGTLTGGGAGGIPTTGARGANGAGFAGNAARGASGGGGVPGPLGGVAGFAIRPNGNAVTLVVNGTLWGSVGGPNTSVPGGTILLPGQTLLSEDRRIQLKAQTDGNLVIYLLTNPGGPALWASNTAGVAVQRTEFQTDGNLVIYKTNGTAAWASNTAGNPGSTLSIQNDGNLVIYKADHSGLWSTGSAPY